jgi:hypothetical protein
VIAVSDLARTAGLGFTGRDSTGGGEMATEGLVLRAAFPLSPIIAASSDQTWFSARDCVVRCSDSGAGRMLPDSRCPDCRKESFDHVRSILGGRGGGVRCTVIGWPLYKTGSDCCAEAVSLIATGGVSSLEFGLLLPFLARLLRM